MPRAILLPEKARWLILVAGLTASIPLYAVVALVLASSAELPAAPVPASLRYGIYGAAFALALVALAVAPRAGADPATALSFGTFYRRTLVSLAVAETSAILGLVLFLLGRSLADFLVLAGLSLAVSLVGIVPRGLRWFRQREESSPGGGAPPVSPG